MEIQTLAVGIIFVIIFYIIKHRPHVVGPNEPPLVPYTIPILGHTYNYLFNPKTFLKECKEQYGECFSIYVFGSVITVASRKFINEIFKSHDDFDFMSALNEMIPFHKIYTYNGGLTRENVKFHAKATREQITGKLDTILPVVQKYIVKGIDKWIGDCDDPKTFHDAWKLVNTIIALPAANLLVGEEAASHEDLVKSFGDLAFDLNSILLLPPIFSFIHKKLQDFIITLPMRFGWNPVSYYRKVTLKRLKPVIARRLKEKKVLGDSYKPYNDLFEYYMSLPNFDPTKPNNLLYHVDNIFVMIFASIATTSRAAANALYDLAGRPECLKELYEEALTINNECNGSITLSDIQKMKKLDSFIKESLRHTDDILSTPHYTISESHTFSNGFTIPKGRMSILYHDDLLKSKEAYGDDAEEFKPFRFVNTDSPATKVDRSYVAFGGGKHACPGRFFAINKLKLIFHYLIMKYNITTKSGKIENKEPIGPFAFPPRSAIVFENRK